MGHIRFLVAVTLMLGMACAVLYSSVDVAVRRPVGANVTLNAAAGPCLGRSVSLGIICKEVGSSGQALF